MYYDPVKDYAYSIGYEGRIFVRSFFYGPNRSVIARMVDNHPELVNRWIRHHFDQQHMLDFEQLMSLSNGQLFKAALEAFPDDPLNEVVVIANRLMYKVVNQCSPDGERVSARALRWFLQRLSVEIDKYME